MSVTASPRREDLVDVLGLDELPEKGYRQRDHLVEAIDAGFGVADIAAAYDVAPKTVYRALAEHSINTRKPPSNGLAKQLHDADPSAVGGGS